MKTLAFSSILILAFLSGSFSLGNDAVILVDPVNRCDVTTIQTANSNESQQEQLLITPSPNVDSLDFNTAHQKICQRSHKKQQATNAPKQSRQRRRWFKIW